MTEKEGLAASCERGALNIPVKVTDRELCSEASNLSHTLGSPSAARFNDPGFSDIGHIRMCSHRGANRKLAGSWTVTRLSTESVDSGVGAEYH